MSTKIQAVLFDFIGTTVKEKSDTVLSSFKKAFLDHVGDIDMHELENNRGKDKKAMIAHILKHHNYPGHLMQPVFDSFNRYMEDNVTNFSEMDDAGELFTFLKSKNVKIGIGTGLPRRLFDTIYKNLNWNRYKFDYIGISNEIGNSRPAPDMIFDMMKKTGANDKAEFLKIGDTAADIQEGKNAGVLTAIFLSGSQKEEIVLNESPDFIFKSLPEIKTLFKN